jgi:NTE family protein
MRTRRPLLLISAILLAGCSIKRFENTALQSSQTNPERRSINPATTDRPAILMTFSGGGSRAAALAGSVLSEIAATPYTASDGPHILIEDVKLISSVSGGSVTAA